MNILIVEDEIDILRGTQDVVEHSGVPFKRIFAVRSAEEALELIEEFKPEIILTDILLPEMTGLDMLEKVRELPYDPKVVVISSYNNFQYAQRSLQLGASDYILKPIHKEELAEKIRTVYGIIQNEARSRELSKDQTVYARLGTETLKERFVLGLCLQKTPLQEHIHHRLQVWDLLWLETQSYVVISLHALKDGLRTKQDKEIDLGIFAVGNIAEETLRDYGPSVMVRNVHNDWVIITACDDELLLTQDLADRVLKYQKLHLNMGISERMYSFQAVSEAYEHAQKALKVSSLNQNHPIVRYVDIESIINKDGGQTSSGWVAECILEGRTDEIERSLEDMLHRLMMSKDVSSTADLSIRCFEWILEIHSCLTEKVSTEISHFPLDLWEKADGCKTVDELKLLLRNHLMELAETVGSGQPSAPVNFNIDIAKRIIDRKYGESITLQSVADELSIHPVWLSRLFKKETGQTFLDYLTEIRIEKAKHMLRNTTLKIYEVAERTGYQETQYFGKLFKKRTGFTPKEYRYGK